MKRVDQSESTSSRELQLQHTTNSSINQYTNPSQARSQLANTAKMPSREPRFNQHLLFDTTPLPDSIPKVNELGASSAPLMSASYFIGARCRAYNDDYMKCKTEAYGKGAMDCMKEGRKVTRCAGSVIDDINKNCLEQFRLHWQCLEKNNQQMWQCRNSERPLNACVFEKLKLEKTIPGTPANEEQVHLRRRQIYSHYGT